MGKEGKQGKWGREEGRKEGRKEKREGGREGDREGRREGISIQDLNRVNVEEKFK